MSTEKVHFTKERETLLFTLQGKALQSLMEDPVLPDKWAVEAVSRIDYDFDKLKTRNYESRLIAIRSREFDNWTSSFLGRNPSGTVLHLGCGLDSRVFRVNPPSGVRWFDVDYPEVIELRRRLFPERAGYHMIGTALEDPGWETQVSRDQPALIVAEGVMMYLTEEIVRGLLNRLTVHFPRGELVFDAWNNMTLRGAQRRGIKGTGATFGWAIDDPLDIKKLEPRLELAKELRASEMAAFPRMPLWSRILVHIMDPIPALRRANRILIYRF